MDKVPASDISASTAGPQPTSDASVNVNYNKADQYNDVEMGDYNEDLYYHLSGEEGDNNSSSSSSNPFVSSQPSTSDSSSQLSLSPRTQQQQSSSFVSNENVQNQQRPHPYTQIRYNQTPPVISIGAVPIEKPIFEKILSNALASTQNKDLFIKGLRALSHALSFGYINLVKEKRLNQQQQQHVVSQKGLFSRLPDNIIYTFFNKVPQGLHISGSADAGLYSLSILSYVLNDPQLNERSLAYINLDHVINLMKQHSSNQKIQSNACVFLKCLSSTLITVQDKHSIQAADHIASLTKVLINMDISKIILSSTKVMPLDPDHYYICLATIRNIVKLMKFIKNTMLIRDIVNFTILSMKSFSDARMKSHLKVQIECICLLQSVVDASKSTDTIAQKALFDCILQSIKSFSTNSIMVKLGIKLIKKILSSKETTTVNLFLSDKGISGISSIIKAIPEDKKMIMACLGIFESLKFGTEPVSTGMCNDNGIASILSLLSADPYNRNLQIRGLRLIQLCFCDTGNNKTMINNEVASAISKSNGFDVVLSAMQNFTDSYPLALIGCTIFYQSSSFSVAKRQLMNDKIITSVVMCMNLFPTNEITHTLGCCIIGNLFINVPNRRHLIENKSILAVVVRLFGDPPRKPITVRCGLQLLRNLLLQNSQLSPDLVNDASFIFANVQQEPKLLSSFVNVAKRYADDKAIAEIATSIFFLLSTSSSGTNAIVINDGIPYVVSSMSKFVDSLETQKNSCGFLWAVTCNNNSNKNLVAKEGGIKSAMRAVHLFPKDKELNKNVTGLLRNLASTPEIQSLFLQDQVLQYLVQAMQKSELSKDTHRNIFAIVCILAGNPLFPASLLQQSYLHIGSNILQLPIHKDDTELKQYYFGTFKHMAQNDLVRQGILGSQALNKFLLDSIINNTADLKLFKLCLSIASRLVVDISHLEDNIFIKLNYIPMLINVLEKSANSEQSIQSIFAFLEAMTESKSGSKAMLSSNALSTLISLSEKYPLEPKIQKPIISILVNIFEADFQTLTILLKIGMVNILSTASKAFPNDVVIQQKCARGYSLFALYEQGQEAIISRKDVVDNIFQNIKKYIDIDSYQQEISLFLQGITIYKLHRNTKDEFINTHIIPTLLDAMKRNPKSLIVQQNSCSILSILISSSISSIKNPKVIIEPLLSAMKALPNNFGVTHTVCFALAQLAQNRDNHVEIVKNEGVQRLFYAFEKFPLVSPENHPKRSENSSDSYSNHRALEQNILSVLASIGMNPEQKQYVASFMKTLNPRVINTFSERMRQFTPNQAKVA